MNFLLAGFGWFGWRKGRQKQTTSLNHAIQTEGEPIVNKCQTRKKEREKTYISSMPSFRFQFSPVSLSAARSSWGRSLNAVLAFAWLANTKRAWLSR